jgi:NADPH-dependent glutamate synthase beta subunit-like oxidoreductase
MKTVFVVGAGPAGLFAAQKIAQSGAEVIVLNRDIKPGGLAEYGIYPVKDKMKVGLKAVRESPEPSQCSLLWKHVSWQWILAFY